MYPLRESTSIKVLTSFKDLLKTHFCIFSSFQSEKRRKKNENIKKDFDQLSGAFSTEKLAKIPITYFIYRTWRTKPFIIPHFCNHSFKFNFFLFSGNTNGWRMTQFKTLESGKLWSLSLPVLLVECLLELQEVELTSAHLQSLVYSSGKFKVEFGIWNASI